MDFDDRGDAKLLKMSHRRDRGPRDGCYWIGLSGFGESQPLPPPFPYEVTKLRARIYLLYPRAGKLSSAFTRLGGSRRCKIDEGIVNRRRPRARARGRKSRNFIPLIGTARAARRASSETRDSRTHRRDSLLRRLSLRLIV